ncbi:MgtC/SapB family protein [Tabrizicola sp.]|uniref:MgtC/SapB family protein n=1 Tax=Tabrizicola sp. TaxID=2005166 RepID=UPI00286B3420|nr:MgtC/SapB family protein [Tabrizicola sp.]
MELFQTWNMDDALSHLVGLVVAYLLALPIGWNREREERSAGLRTFPLVAMGACGFVMIAIEVLGVSSDGHARILEGLMTGIGFIGGGAILKQGDRATGTATAASLWATGAIGAAVGYGQLDIAVILSVVVFLTLTLLAPLKKVAQDVADAPPRDS